MATLMDIAVVPNTVEVNGVDVNVTGVSGRGIVALMGRFPEIGKMMSGVKVDLDAKMIMKLVPDALAAIIAAGTGFPGSEDAEKAADALPIGAQLDLIDRIIRVTMPRGVGPFVQKLEALGVLVDVQGLKTPLDTPSPSPSSS